MKLVILDRDGTVNEDRDDYVKSPEEWVPLPEGVTLDPAEVPEKGGDVTLKLIASPDAKPFSGSIRLVATEAESGFEHSAIASLTSSTENTDDIITYLGVTKAV
jgi:hypothetical protein